MKEKTKNKVSFWVSLIAILIAGASLWVSYISWKTADKAFQINLQPILDSEFNIDNDKKQYFLTLINKGPNTIYDLNFEAFTRLVNLEDGTLPMQVGGPVKDLEKNKKIEPGERYTVPITAYMENAIGLKDYSLHKNDENFDVYYTFYLTFNRMPDMKQFDETRTLLVTRDSKTRELLVIDPYKRMKFNKEIIKDLKKLFSF